MHHHNAVSPNNLGDISWYSKGHKTEINNKVAFPSFNLSKDICTLTSAALCKIEAQPVRETGIGHINVTNDFISISVIF